MTASKIVLSALAIATALTTATHMASAQSGFVNGQPVFQSDIDARNAADQAAREERRKTYAPTVYPAFMQGGEKPDLAPQAPPVVYLDQPEEAGTVIVDTSGKRLFYVMSGNRAYQYPISVGRDGFTWTGTERVSRIASWPTWTPPPEMRQRQKGLPVTVTGGMINPLGARALYLGSTIYRIHGTNNDRSIGRASSSGCFRMMNEHVVHLTTLAKVGTKVRVVANYTGGVNASAPLSSLFDFGSSATPAPAAPAKTKTSKKN